MSKFTPGPWHVGMKPGPMVYGPQGEHIVGMNVLLDQPEVIANARAIAALPEMVELLAQYMAILPCEYHGNIHCSMVPAGAAHKVCPPCQARAILAKIEG